jgi:hypothetical protein
MTWACFLPCCYWGQVPCYKLAAAARRTTEICLRNFGQIARWRRLAPKSSRKSDDKVTVVIERQPDGNVRVLGWGEGHFAGSGA